MDDGVMKAGVAEEVRFVGISAAGDDESERIEIAVICRPHGRRHSVFVRTIAIAAGGP